MTVQTIAKAGLLRSCWVVTAVTTSMVTPMMNAGGQLTDGDGRYLPDEKYWRACDVVHR
jgi:hypothetical protein